MQTLQQPEQFLWFTKNPFLVYLLNVEILSPTFSSAPLAPQAASVIQLQSQKPKMFQLFFICCK